MKSTVKQALCSAQITALCTTAHATIVAQPDMVNAVHCMVPLACPLWLLLNPLSAVPFTDDYDFNCGVLCCVVSVCACV